MLATVSNFSALDRQFTRIGPSRDLTTRTPNSRYKLSRFAREPIILRLAQNQEKA